MMGERALVANGVIRHAHDSSPPVVEGIPDRPLVSGPCIDAHMYGRPGLCTLAPMGITNRGGCVVAIFGECVTVITKDAARRS